MVYAEFLDITTAFKSKKLGYITHILYNTSDPKLHLWDNNKYKEVVDLIKKLHICYEYAMLPKEIITYGSLIQEYMGEYHNIVNLKQW